LSYLGSALSESAYEESNGSYLIHGRTMFEGTGEANRAVEVALGTGLPDKRPLFEPGEDAIGTGRGRGDDGDPPSRGVDMVPLFLDYCKLLS